jgi:biotin synthase
VCSGGIVGMGETRTDRAGMLVTLANLPEHPQSVPINQLVRVQGTPLHGEGGVDASRGVDGFEFVRTIAVARILMPEAQVRLSAGREEMSDELQALAFASANSIFYGENCCDRQSDARPGAAGDEDPAETQQQRMRGCC